MAESLGAPFMGGGFTFEIIINGMWWWWWWWVELHALHYVADKYVDG